jgi:hypothetical protein
MNKYNNLNDNNLLKESGTLQNNTTDFIDEYIIINDILNNNLDNNKLDNNNLDNNKLDDNINNDIILENNIDINFNDEYLNNIKLDNNIIIENTELNNINIINDYYKTLKQKSLVYKMILNKNRKLTDKLISTSLFFSITIGMLTSFKIILNNNFGQGILIILNIWNIFIIMFLKKYVYDKRNDIIQINTNNINIFINNLLNNINFDLLNKMYTDLISNTKDIEYLDILKYENC